jgi:hypothetical protein
MRYDEQQNPCLLRGPVDRRSFENRRHSFLDRDSLSRSAALFLYGNRAVTPLLPNFTFRSLITELLSLPIC